MSFGDVWGFGADEQESHRILGEFADAGGNFVDTANKCHEGQTEETLGSFLGPGRDRWVVATKYSRGVRPVALRLGADEAGVLTGKYTRGPASHPDPGRSQAGAAPGRPGQPGGGAGGRVTVPRRHDGAMRSCGAVTNARQLADILSGTDAAVVSPGG